MDTDNSVVKAKGGGGKGGEGRQKWLGGGAMGNICNGVNINIFNKIKPYITLLSHIIFCIKTSSITKIPLYFSFSCISSSF